MLLCMALSTEEIHAQVTEVRRVLRPGGVFVYTVRHTGDAHYGADTGHGDDIWEHGGFAVHFFPPRPGRRPRRRLAVAGGSPLRGGWPAPPAVARHPGPVPMSASPVPAADLTVDGTGLLCVTLLLRLRARIAGAEPGTVVYVIATDPAVPLDLPAWCHMVGHDYLGPVSGADRMYALRLAADARPTRPGAPWHPAEPVR